MSTTLLRTLLIAIVLLAAPGVVRASADQEALQKVKALYAAAAYEDALAVVAAVAGDVRAPELDQYRAFCLIALGQSQQAQLAIETLLTTDPLYEPNPNDTSPRVIDAFNEVRTRVLPGVAKKLYVEAKADLEDKKRDEAIKGFETLLEVIKSADSMDETLADMKVLAEGFLDLSRALPEPTPEPASTAVTAVENAPESAAPSPAPVSSRPVPLKQELPRWNAPDPISRRAEYTGVLRVRVGVDGTVQSAEMVRRTHPMYDSALVAAAREWLYEPARQNGKPIPAEVLVEVRLRPQE